MVRARRSESAGPSLGAADAQFRCNDNSYFDWTAADITLRDRKLAVVSKPGVPAFGELDPSEGLLLDHIEVAATDVVYSLNCGSAAVAALAGLRSTHGRVHTFDDNYVALEAARRTQAANGLTNSEAAFGYDSTAHELEADVVLVRLPKGKVPALQLIWKAYQSLKQGGRCYLAGGTDEGIKAGLKHLQELFGNAVVVGYRSGHRVGVATRPDGPAQRTGAFDIPWLDSDHYHSYTVSVRGHSFQAFSRPGVFSWERLDTGTEALLEVLDVQGRARILDLGCGAGVVGVSAALQAPAAQVTMLDVNAEAVRSSRRTVAANGLEERCEVLASDVAQAVADRQFDLVITNPPFHIDRATDLAVPAQFIRDAARVLGPGGKFYVVANRTLPYEAWLDACFGAHKSELAGRQFKVLSAIKKTL